MLEQLEDRTVPSSAAFGGGLSGVVAAGHEALLSGGQAAVSPAQANPSADLSVTATGPTTVTAGTNATYTITLTNIGPDDAQTVALTDTLPTGAVLVSLTPNANNPDAFTTSGANANATTVKATNTDTFVLVVSAPSSLANAANFSETSSVSSATADPNPNNNTSTVTGAIAASADLAVTATGPATVTAGTNATYTITLTSTGPSDAQTVALTDTLPTGAVLVSLTPNANNPDAFTTSGANANATTVKAGHTDTFVLVVSAPSSLANAANFSATASVSSATADPTTTDNTATVTGAIATSADVSVTPTGPATANEGDLITYTFTVANSGPSDAQAVSLTDVLPRGLTFVSANISQGSFVQMAGTITYSLGVVASGKNATASVVVRAKLSVGNQTSMVTVSSTTSDPNTANNSASPMTLVAEGPLTVTGVDVNDMEFGTLNGVTVASVTHAGGIQPASDFAATINWGDGTSSVGTVVQSGTSYLVQGTHTYGDEHTFTISVTVTEDNVSGTSTSHAAIGEAPLPAGVANTSLNNQIDETIDQFFGGQGSAQQYNTLAFLLGGLEVAGAGALMAQGVDPFTAMSVSSSLGQGEMFSFSKFLSTQGISLNTAVSDIEFLFIMQGPLMP